MVVHEPREAPKAPPNAAAGLIDACDARPTDHVTIAGCENLELLIDFFRHGFTDAGCQADRGPHDGDRPSDVLVVPRVASDLALLHVVTRLGGDLRPGGMLVLRDDRPLAAGQRRQLLNLLAQRGFVPIDRVASFLASGGILRARKIVKSAEVLAA
ncbi:MAG: hypothetical protein JWL84_2549 [Rhodospirillales bacterium]|jgi:hypothetical protein|nr:hypothetical protein [Rhodospirillales bacterium]